jgi:hypothetical protein
MEFYRVARAAWQSMEDDMELHENGTEVERLLAAAWEYEHRTTWKATLAKWLFPLTLSGAVVTVYDLPDVKTAVTSVLAPAETKPTFDAVAAANVEEDIDYRIAQREKSLAGWHTFLEAHRDGPHAEAAHAQIERLLPTPPPQPDAHGSGDYGQAASAEVEKTLLAEEASSPGAAPEVSTGASPDAKAASEVMGSAPPSPGVEAAALTPDEICKRDGDRLERLRSSPTSDEAARFANELGCEKLRPQLLGLMGSLGYAAPTSPAAEVANGAPTHAKAGTEVVGTEHYRATKETDPEVARKNSLARHALAYSWVTTDAAGHRWVHIRPIHYSQQE